MALKSTLSDWQIQKWYRKTKNDWNIGVRRKVSRTIQKIRLTGRATDEEASKFPLSEESVDFEPDDEEREMYEHIRDEPIKKFTKEFGWSGQSQCKKSK